MEREMVVLLLGLPVDKRGSAGGAEQGFYGEKEARCGLGSVGTANGAVDRKWVAGESGKVSDGGKERCFTGIAEEMATRIV